MAEKEGGSHEASLTIDTDHSLLACRRRFQAISELGWQEVECHVLPVDGDQLKAFRVAIDENLKSKRLTEVEEGVGPRVQLQISPLAAKPMVRYRLLHRFHFSGQWVRDFQ